MRSARALLVCAVGRDRSREHRVSPEELRHCSSDGLGTLDVQEMADAADRALLDVRE
jgi:hypothetical protein